jgi:hypothetical protein
MFTPSCIGLLLWQQKTFHYTTTLMNLEYHCYSGEIDPDHSVPHVQNELYVWGNVR